MALEKRGNNYYLYKKRRIGNRVISEYYGGGELARMMQLLEDADREKANEVKEHGRRTIEAERLKHAELDAELEDFHLEAGALQDAIFLINGHHSHSRQWRRKRYAGKSDNENKRNDK